MKILKVFLKKNRRLCFYAAVVISLQTISMLFIPFFISYLINDGIMQKNFDVIKSTGLAMLGTLIVGTLLGILGSHLSAEVGAKFGRQNRKLLFRNVQELTVAEVDSYGVPSLMTRVLSDNVNVQQMIVAFFQMIFPSPIMSAAAVILTYKISPKLALVPLGTIILFVVVVLLVLNKSNPYIKNIQIKMDKMTLVLREFFMGVKIIRAFDNSSYEKKRVDCAFKDYADNVIRIDKFFAVLTPIAYCLMTLSMPVIIWLGSRFVVQGEMEIGSITAIIEYITLTILSLVMSSMVLFQMPKAMASLDRISTVILEKTEMVDAEEEQAISQERADCVVSFDHVDFRYENAEEPVLEAISFTIKRGETFAIVGGTGSGKSSIAKVLLRLNDIQSGTIKVNNQDIRKIKLAKLRDAISFVPQRAFLFSGTIKENIMFGNHHLTTEEMKRVAETAQADTFIEGLPDQYESRVAQGGTNFSGGQKQRIAIARALAKPSDIYIFDDSFSALDYTTDAKLRHAIKKTLKNAAVMIIAQRLSTITDADKIVVLDEGKMVGEGTHEELLKSNTVYRELAYSQNLLTEKEVS